MALLEQLIAWGLDYPFLSIPLLVYIDLCLLGLLAFLIHPSSLIAVNHALSVLDIRVAGVTLGPRDALFIKPLSNHPRALDAWIAARIVGYRDRFIKTAVVARRRLHIDLPVILEDADPHVLSAPDLRGVFAKPTAALLIWGRSGTGKTSLACRIAYWSMSDKPSERIASHRMLPVLIEDGLSPSVAEGGHPLKYAIRDQLRASLTSQPISQDLLDALLRRRRVLVIIDHLSEMDQKMRGLVQPMSPDFPAKALVVTSRLKESLSGGYKVINTFPINGNNLFSFVEAYLSKHDDVDFSSSRVFDICRRLTEIAKQRDVSVVIAKLYLEQFLRGKKIALPTNLPDLIWHQITSLHRGVADTTIEEGKLLDYAMILAWACLRIRFRPEAIAFEYAVILQRGARRYLQHLEHGLGVIESLQPSRFNIQFSLGLVAEYLAALYLVRKNGRDRHAWQTFLFELGAQSDSHNEVAAFLLAVYDAVAVRGAAFSVPSFVLSELAKLIERSGEQVASYKEQQSERSVSLPDQAKPAARTAEERKEEAASVPPVSFKTPESREGPMSWSAAIALGSVGPEVVPSLIKALHGDDPAARGSAIDGLREIGEQASLAIPDLITCLNDEDPDIPWRAANALSAIGVSAVPALVEIVKEEGPGCKHAIDVLSELGPRALEAVPVLSEVLRHGDVEVRWRAADALTAIGPQAKEAVSALVDALQDEDESVRCFAQTALEKIQPGAASA